MIVKCRIRPSYKVKRKTKKKSLSEVHKEREKCYVAPPYRPPRG